MMAWLLRFVFRRTERATTGLSASTGTIAAADTDSAGAPQMLQPDTAHRLMADSLDIARSQVGIREVPRNSNRGPEVEAYQDAVGIKPGNAWCQAFVFWCVRSAWREMNDGWTEEEGAPPVPILRSGWTHAVWLWMEKQGHTYTPGQVLEGQAVPAGALFFLWGKVGWGDGVGVHHVGFVRGIDRLAETVLTCEGNTDGSGSNEGGGVYVLERSLQDIHAFGIYG